MKTDRERALNWLDHASKVATLGTDGHVRSTIDGDIYHHLETIRKALSEPQWRPIKDAKPVSKGFMRVYSYSPVIHDKSRGYCDLVRAFKFESVMGLRECDMYFDIPAPPAESDKP